MLTWTLNIHHHPFQFVESMSRQNGTILLHSSVERDKKDPPLLLSHMQKTWCCLWLRRSLPNLRWLSQVSFWLGYSCSHHHSWPFHRPSKLCLCYVTIASGMPSIIFPFKSKVLSVLVEKGRKWENPPHVVKTILVASRHCKKFNSPYHYSQ